MIMTVLYESNLDPLIKKIQNELSKLLLPVHFLINEKYKNEIHLGFDKKNNCSIWSFNITG